MTNKTHVKKGDTVIVISGKDKGKKGKVLSVKDGKIVVEGVNIATSHVKPTREMQQGGIIEQEAPFYSARAMIYCKKCNKATRIGKKELQDGTKVRICKKCDEVLDK